jgi:hypothetical protein
MRVIARTAPRRFGRRLWDPFVKSSSYRNPANGRDSASGKPSTDSSQNAPDRLLGKARTSVRDIGILTVIALVTRIPMLGIGEADSALFATGARQWLRGGPHNLSIYSAQVCAFYYLCVTALIRWSHLTERNCVMLMSILSLAGGIGILAFGYLLGVRFVGPRAALAGMLLFAFSPGLWWITAEPHPQAVSICFGIAAIWSFCRYLESGSLLAASSSSLYLAIAIAVKIDAILMAPALLALVFWMGTTWRNVARAAIVTIAAAALAVGLPRLLIGAASRPIVAGKQSVEIFARIPSLFDLLRESAPIFFGIGIITTVALFVGAFLSLGKQRDGWRWAAVLAAWCLPGYLFWLCIAGNNTRHVVAFGIPLFWLGARGLRTAHVAACLLISLLIPPNSNIGLFPSPNVPGSARLFAEKRREIGSLADSLAKQSSCVVGSYTNDYLANSLLDTGGRIQSQISSSDVSTATVSMPNGNVVQFKRINPRQKSLDLGSCQSLEYRRDGRKVRFLGSEWHLPIV